MSFIKGELNVFLKTEADHTPFIRGRAAGLLEVKKLLDKARQ